MRLLTTLAFVLTSVTAAAQQVIYVDSTATGANTGSSWANAITSLRSALDGALVGSDLWVAEGTYLPGPTVTAADTFQLKNGVRLYGGFAGNESSTAQRDWVLHPTILSGATGPGQSAHVVTASGVNLSAELDGFIVAYGGTGPPNGPAGSYDKVGGGLFSLGGSPTVRNCTFSDNFSYGPGGAIY